VIKIRYASLPVGLHVRTVIEGRHTILYLLPGLTTVERRAAIGRARRNARVGYGPPLPAREMAVAITTDQIRTTVGNGFTALRLNPAFFLPAGILVASVAVAYLLLSSVSIQFREPGNAGPGPRPGGGITAAPGPSLSSPAGPARRAGDPVPGQQEAGGPGGRTPGQAGSPGPAPDPSSRPRPSSAASPQPTVSGQPPGLRPMPPSPAPSLVPSPTLSPSPAATGLCLGLGPVGVCLN
jgi:hypothetical protein